MAPGNTDGNGNAAGDNNAAGDGNTDGAGGAWWLPVAAGRCRVVAGTRVWFAICGKRACGKHAIGHN